MLPFCLFVCFVRPVFLRGMTVLVGMWITFRSSVCWFRRFMTLIFVLSLFRLVFVWITVLAWWTAAGLADRVPRMFVGYFTSSRRTFRMTTRRCFRSLCLNAGANGLIGWTFCPCRVRRIPWRLVLLGRWSRKTWRRWWRTGWGRRSGQWARRRRGPTAVRQIVMTTFLGPGGNNVLTTHLCLNRYQISTERYRTQW